MDCVLCRIPLNLTWGQRVKAINVHWFQYESDPAMNSNVYDVAQKAVNDNFPGTEITSLINPFTTEGIIICMQIQVLPEIESSIFLFSMYKSMQWLNTIHPIAPV